MKRSLQSYQTMPYGFLDRQTIMRMMDNCSIETDSVKLIQDDLNYYVESNQEPDFAENEMMYDDLELEETMSNIYSTTGAVCNCS